MKRMKQNSYVINMYKQNICTSMYNIKLMFIFAIIIYVWFLYGSDGPVSVLIKDKVNLSETFHLI